MISLNNDNSFVTDLLLQQPTLDVNVRDTTQKTAIEIALLEKRDPKVAQRLVEKNSNLNMTDSTGGTC